MEFVKMALACSVVVVVVVCAWPIVIFSRLKYNATIIIIIRITIIIVTDKTKKSNFFLCLFLSMLLVELGNSSIKTRQGLSTLRE